jgi:hypothetical protein
MEMENEKENHEILKRSETPESKSLRGPGLNFEKLANLWSIQERPTDIGLNKDRKLLLSQQPTP